MIQETRMQGHGIHEIESSSRGKLHLYYSGHKDKLITGTGILVKPNSKVNVIPASQRICMMKIKSSNSSVIYSIRAYTPTLETTVKKSETTRAFYEYLWSLMKAFKVREAVIIGGDFNAKTKSKFDKQLSHKHQWQISKEWHQHSWRKNDWTLYIAQS